MTLTNRCYLCMEDEESMDHLLLHCARTRILWELLFSLFSTTWVTPRTVKDTLLTWNSFFIGKRRRKVWPRGPRFVVDTMEGQEWDCL